jgi:hypothetical protein
MVNKTNHPEEWDAYLKSLSNTPEETFQYLLNHADMISPLLAICHQFGSRVVSLNLIESETDKFLELIIDAQPSEIVVDRKPSIIINKSSGKLVVHSVHEPLKIEESKPVPEEPFNTGSAEKRAEEPQGSPDIDALFGYLIVPNSEQWDIIKKKLMRLRHSEWKSITQSIAEEEKISEEKYDIWKYIWDTPYDELSEEYTTPDRIWAEQVMKYLFSEKED